MGEFPLPQEILERILEFVDGKTLLMCKHVSPQFAAAVKYLTNSKNIWERCYTAEMERFPFAVISKLYPHKEGLSHHTDWAPVYEKCALKSVFPSAEHPQISHLKIGKDWSQIHDIQTHGDLVLILVRYNKNFARFYRILTINLDNVIIDKSSSFNADKLYVTPIEDSSNGRRDFVILNCDSCVLVAVPVDVDPGIEGFPKFKKKINFLTVRHSNGDYLWLDSSRALLSKGDAFLKGKVSKLDVVKSAHAKLVKVFQSFTLLYISYGDTHKEFNTFKEIRASITASMCYSNLLILGTNTGMLYVYNLNSERDLQLLDLGCFLYQFNVTSDPILMINIMELKNDFVIVCCTSKFLYRVHNPSTYYQQ